MKNSYGKQPEQAAGTSTNNPTVINGYGKHPDTGLMVAWNGHGVYTDSGMMLGQKAPAFFDLLQDDDGEVYISVPQKGYWLRKFMVKDLVAETFGLVKPGADYIVVHKNGVTWDNRFENLEYHRRITMHPHIAACTARSVKQTINHSTYTVMRDGSVKQDGKYVPIQKSFFNPDNNLHIPMAWPKVSIANKFCGGMTTHTEMDMDQVMANAGYVDGNPKSFENPAVLHKDHNLYNFYSRNLAWCERYGTDYRNYIDSVCSQLNVMAQRMNPRQWTDDRNFEPGRLIYLPGFYTNQVN